MQRSVLVLDKAAENCYQTVFRTTHGRKIYLCLQEMEEQINICDCFYVDRPMKVIPQRWKTRYCDKNELLKIIENELDKKFYGIQRQNTTESQSAENYIESKLSAMARRRYQFLIFVENDDILRTRLKNRVHRMIYLELKHCSNGKGVIQACHYYDRKYKRTNTLITPAGLKTIYFTYNSDNILDMVNRELNCQFTDVILTKDTFGFDKSDLPLCGAI